jgi:hypothetical protein
MNTINLIEIDKEVNNNISNSFIYKYKACLIVRGFRQKNGRLIMISRILLI